MEEEFTDIPPPETPASVLTASQVATGRIILPQQQLLLYSSDDWEGFVHEWTHFCLKNLYVCVQRFTGAGDRGIDIAGFADKTRFRGVWDNYQCKHYNRSLRATDVWPEIGKILWYTFRDDYVAPRKCYFVAPRGAATSLLAMLSDPARLKAELIENWDKHCSAKITDTKIIALEGSLLAHVQAFDFSIFDAKTALQLVEAHRDSPYHAARFGGGLPARPAADSPPVTIAPTESKYVAKLLEAYSDHTKTNIPDIAALKKQQKLSQHFIRQREAFYQAENLRVFSRDSVPPGTFENLQEDIYAGVIDEHDKDHPDGYVRVVEVAKAARAIQITANPLITCSHPKDRDGICHQLANEDRLQWTKS